MKRRNQDPYQYSLTHVQQRALERYGLELDQYAYNRLNARARNRLFAQDLEEKGSQTTMIMRFEGHDLVVVYCSDKDLVTTLLPPEQFAPYLPI